MDVYILSSVCQDLLSEQSSSEIAEDLLTSGSLYLTFDGASQNAQSFVEDVWQVDDYSAIALAWADIGEQPETVWKAECEELGFEFMIRKFVL